MLRMDCSTFQLVACLLRSAADVPCACFIPDATHLHHARAAAVVVQFCQEVNWFDYAFDIRRVSSAIPIYLALYLPEKGVAYAVGYHSCPNAMRRAVLVVSSCRVSIRVASSLHHTVLVPAVIALNCYFLLYFSPAVPGGRAPWLARSSC